LNYERDYTGAAMLLTVVCAVMGIVAGLWTISKWNAYGTVEHVVGLVMLAAAVLAVWGSRRYVSTGRNFKMAILFGGICSIVCGLIFGLMVLLLILMSKKEFDDLTPALLDKQ